MSNLIIRINKFIIENMDHSSVNFGNIIIKGNKADAKATGGQSVIGDKMISNPTAVGAHEVS